ncbi:unnamed protein product, partial [Rotaria sp. Silwood1]
DSLAPTSNIEQQNAQSRGRTFLCRMRTNDESSPYVTMIVSVALHRDSASSDKTFLRWCGCKDEDGVRAHILNLNLNFQSNYSS